MAARLLGVDAIRLWHDQALYKEPGGRETDPHQDQPYWPIEEADTITAWIPLDGSTMENGAMGYLPGSHRLGIRKFVNIFFGPPEDVLASDGLRGVQPVYVEVPPGGVAFHHGLTFHLARPNMTDRPRRGNLFPRRMQKGIGAPTSLGRQGRHQIRRGDRQRRHADRLAQESGRPAHGSNN